VLRLVFSDIPEVSLVYLFGSQVRGKTGPMSDYDLGVLLENPKDKSQVLAQLAHAAAVVLRTDRIDLAPLQGAAVE
jgi:predicted nucleotidyltransferase